MVTLFILLIMGYRILKTVLLNYFLSLYWRVMINLLSARSLSMLVKVFLKTNVMVATGKNYSISVRDAFPVRDALLLRHVELCVPPISA